MLSIGFNFKKLCDCVIKHSQSIPSCNTYGRQKYRDEKSLKTIRAYVSLRLLEKSPIDQNKILLKPESEKNV